MSMMARDKMKFQMGGLTGGLEQMSMPRPYPSPNMPSGPINTGAKRPGLFSRMGTRFKDKFSSPDFLNNLSQRLRKPMPMGGGMNMGGMARPNMFQRPQMTRPLPQNNQPQMRRATSAWMNF